MAYVGQLDFGELAAIHDGRLPLPLSGVLSLFYFPEGGDPLSKCRCVFVENAAEADVLPNEAPLSPARRLRASFEGTALQQEKTSLGERHQVLGKASWVQSDERALVSNVLGRFPAKPDQLRSAAAAGIDLDALAEREARWRLLWQIDSDETLGFMWHDGGMLYVLIHEHDLLARRFECAAIVVQST